jgi:hypothetical protein
MIEPVARMHFISGRNPKESGTIIITDDGFVQIEPSAEFVDELARLEEEAVKRSRRIGMIGTGIFFGIGAIIALIAWLMGRVGGEIRHSLSRPRPVDDVAVDTNDIGGIRVVLPGDGPQTVTLEWEKGEIDECEAAHFVSVYKRFREVGKPNV